MTHVNKIRASLLSFMQSVTGKPHYQPEIVWDKRIWIANVFRGWEYLCGRKFGIRKESSASVRQVNGEIVVVYEFYTVEALLAHIEATIRGYFALFPSFFFYPQPKVNYQPVYLTLSILGFIFSLKTSMHLLPLFGLAIAHDADATSSSASTSPLTWNHTCTGSNRMLAAGVVVEGVQNGIGGGDCTTTAVTYNGVSTTKARADLNTNWDIETSVWLLANPATGSNQVSCTITLPTAGTGGGISTSYSGAQSSSAADASNGTTGLSSGNQTFTVTTVSANCWIFAIGFSYTDSVGTANATIAADQTQRGSTLGIGPTAGNSIKIAAEDTNGAVASGNNTMGFTVGGTDNFIAYGMTGASFAPAAGGAFTWQQLTSNELPLVTIPQRQYVAQSNFFVSVVSKPFPFISINNTGIVSLPKVIGY